MAAQEAIRPPDSFRLIYSALHQCGVRPGELCRVTVPDVDRGNRVITLKEHKTARKTGQAHRIPIGKKLAELLDEAIGNRTEGPVFLGPSGRGWQIGNLSRTYSRLRDLAELPKDLLLYCLLSTFSFLAAGARYEDLPAVKKGTVRTVPFTTRDAPLADRHCRQGLSPF